MWLKTPHPNGGAQGPLPSAARAKLRQDRFAMPVLGLTLLAIYGLLAFGLRMAIELRRTGPSGFIAMRGSASSVEWACAVLFATAVVLCVAGVLLSLIKALPSIAVLNGELASILGAMLACIGIVLTVIAQLTMGDAWRIGVAPSERTELVTHSPSPSCETRSSLQ